MASRLRSEQKSEEFLHNKLSHVDREMSLRGNWNLRAYCSWYVHHEASIHYAFESRFLKAVIPVRNLEIVLEMYLAPPFGDELRMR